MGNAVSSQWVDAAAITFLCFDKGPQLLLIAVCTTDKASRL